MFFRKPGDQHRLSSSLRGRCAQHEVLVSMIWDTRGWDDGRASTPSSLRESKFLLGRFCFLGASPRMMPLSLNTLLIQSPQHVMGRVHLSRIQWFSCFEAVGVWGNSNLSSGQRHCHVVQKLRMICFMVLLQCSKIHFIAAIYFAVICPHLISETK